MLRISICSVTAFLMLAAPAHANALSAAEIQSNLIGTTLNFKNNRGTKGTVIYLKNGDLKWTNENGYHGGGAWRLEKDKLCNKLFRTSTFNGRGWRCNTVRTRPGGKYKMGAGTLWK
ncbi:MAG: hypothetical protein AAGF54_17660 [Pseudomonadota bacterium]